MAESTNAYSLSDKIRQIQGNISTTSTVTGFLDAKPLSRYLTKTNKDESNILKILSDILVMLVGSQDKLKKLLVDILTNSLDPIETKVKQLIKQYTLELLSCGIDAKLNLPLGVVDQPVTYPFIDQYDFYGLFAKNISDPVDGLYFDENLNTFVKTNIDQSTPSFTWSNQDGTEVVRFTYNNPQEKIRLDSPTTSNWGPNGITIKEFVDLYIDSINLFPTATILKSLLDQVFNLKEGDPFDVDLDFLNKLLFKQCNCKSSGTEDDRSKSTFDLGYYDFVPTEITETDETINTNIKFGPVDAPYPNTITPPQPNLDETYLNNVTVLSKNDFKNKNRSDKSDQINNTINNVNQNVYNQTNDSSISLNTKFSIPSLQADVNLKMLLTLPVILAMPVVSPKITMYFGVIYKRYYISDPTKDLWKTKEEYYTFLSKLLELVVKDILEYLLKKLFDIIKREIIKLIKKIIIKVLGEKIMGYITQLKSILDIIKTLTGAIPPSLPSINFKKCQSVLDGISNLFNIPNIPPGSMLPTGLSLMGMVKTGMSPTLMTQDAVKNMNDYGMDTSPMPDGTPNPNVIMASSLSKAMIQQLQTNANIQVTTINSLVYGTGGATIM